MIAEDLTRPWLFVTSTLVTFGLLILAIVSFRKAAKEPMSKKDVEFRMVVAIFLSFAVIWASWSLLVTGEQRRDWDYDYGLEIRLLGASSGLSIIDFPVQAIRVHTSATIYTSAMFNTTNVYNLDDTTMEVLSITCGAPIFWGRSALILNVFSNDERTLFFYHNGSEVVLVDLQEGFWEEPASSFSFAGGGSWARFEFAIIRPPVVAP